MKKQSLKDLTPLQQSRVYEFLKANGGRKTIVFVRSQFKITVHPSGLSDFKSWYQLQLQFHSLDSMRQAFEELLLKKFPQTDPKTVQEFGQSYFTMQAASAGDSETFREMEKLRLLKEKELREASKLSLDREKFEIETCEAFLRWYRDEQKRKIADSDISHAAKIEALRKDFYRDVDDLAKTGSVKIPPA